MREVLYHVEGRADCASEVIARLEGQGWRVCPVADPDAAREKISSRDFRVGLMHLERFTPDLLFPLENLIEHGENLEWLIVLPRTSLDAPSVCKFITENFFDYHTLPIDGQRLSNSLGHAYGKAILKRKAAFGSVDFSTSLIGQSEAMQSLFHQMDKIRSVDTPVLLGGESGTGKELVAQLIHRNSVRSTAPFVTVNCGALPASLIQSELFGHEKGSFTGANERKTGKIEAAQGGTIFLDEIGDLPLDLQTNLLRFLQEKTIERIGSRQSLSIDARVIAATHVDLEQAVKDGLFREDLYYRLNVLNINLPPLRERAGDIELLATAFLKKFSRENHRRIKGFSQQALRVINNHPWPGNVRELINRIQRAVVMSESPLITPKDLGLERRVASRALLTLDQARQIAETEAVRNCLMSNGNNISEATRQLGVSRVTLYRLIDKLQIESPRLCERNDFSMISGANHHDKQDRWN